MSNVRIVINRHKYKSWKDFIYFLILLISGIICIYVFPVIKLVYYITCILLFFLTKKDYLWFCFAFVIMQSPGMLFDKPYNAFINLTSTVSISFVYIFSLVVFFKFRFLIRSTFQKYVFKDLKVIFLYIVFLVLISIVIGISAKSIAYIFYMIASILLFITIPSIIKNKLTLYKFLNVVYFSLFILFIWQVFDVISSKKVYSYFINSLIYNTNSKGINDFVLNRLFYSPGISLISLFTSLFFLSKKDFTYFKKNYLYIIATVSFASIFLTATRGYILQYTFIFLAFMVFNYVKSIKFISVSAIVLIIIIIFFPIFKKQVSMSYERLMTLESFFKGDNTAGNTLIRLTQRAPRVWNKYKESPLFGFGYSDEGVTYNDDHVGNYSILLQGGVLGVFIWIYVIFSIIKSLLYMSRINNINRKLVYLSISFILSIIIAHSTSSIVFTYYLELHIVSIFGIFLIFMQRELYDVENNSLRKIE